MTTHKWNPRQPCPLCGAQNECATNADASNSKPTPGAVIICFSCGLVMILGDDYRLRAPSPSERQELDRAPEVRRVVMAHRATRERRGN
jgi:hypothetical protein